MLFPISYIDSKCYAQVSSQPEYPYSFPIIFAYEMYSQMKEIGIKTAMDDFGTGYSSLGILKQVPANIVKIDRAFVKDIINSRFDITFIEFITRICHSVGIKVCLEGIETKEEFDLVSNLEIDYIQGYYFGKPQPKKSIFENYLIEKTEAHRSSL